MFNQKWYFLLFIIALFSVSLCNESPPNAVSSLDSKEVPFYYGCLIQPNKPDTDLFGCQLSDAGANNIHKQDKTSLMQLTTKEAIHDDIVYHQLEYSQEIPNAFSIVTDIRIFDFGLHI